MLPFQTHCGANILGDRDGISLLLTTRGQKSVLNHISSLHQDVASATQRKGQALHYSFNEVQIP